MSADLLAAVLKNPADDGARLAYASHLRGKSDARGEFIDLQLDFAKHADPTTASAKRLAKKIADLHKKHAAKWAKPLRALGKGVKWEFHRGFVRRLHIVGEPRMAAMNDVFANEPVTDLVVEHAKLPWWKSLLASGGMLRVERLVAFSVEPKTTTLVAAIGKSNVPKLAELRIGLIGDAATKALGALALPAVKHIAIGGGGHGVALTDKGVAGFFEGALGKQVTTLELGRCTITPRMANAVCAAANLSRFSASVGQYDAVESQLKSRFGEGFVVEDEDSFDYLLYGVKGLSK